MNKWTGALCVLISAFIMTAVAIIPALSQEKANSDLAHSIIGTWRVMSFSTLDVESSKLSYPYGEHPTGYIQYSPGGHMVNVMSAEQAVNAKPPFTDAAKIAIYNSLASAYAATYTIQGNKVTHHVINGYRPDWVGGDQTRFLELKGSQLTIKTAPILSLFTGKTVINTLTFVREE